MSAAIEEFFAELWADYVCIAPSADVIHAMFREQGERVLNDHVAFRTFSGPQIGIEALEPHLIALGYRRHAPYRFEAKRLDAWSYLPPDSKYPRVFLSELKRDEFEGKVRTIVDRLAESIAEDAAACSHVFHAGRLWPAITLAEYELLASESEYAGWLASLGMHANHFTISVNELQKTSTLESVLDCVEAAGHAISEAGGRVKGSAEVLLAQGSTRADRMFVEFADGKLKVPTCYTEFAHRFRDEEGELYEGFVPASADRIFESTTR
ncbi:MAG: hypothetical protein ACJAYU_001203 [Bradymonadia bacterium]|jgi:hypothetical protein